MPEYAYNRKYKIWFRVDNPPFVRDYRTDTIIKIDESRLLSPEKIDELRNARKNNKYLIYDNRLKPLSKHPGWHSRLRYPGLDSDYIYEDIADMKLIICNGTRYLIMFSAPGLSSTARIPVDYIINKDIIDPSMQDYSVVVDYVERNAEADMHDPSLLFKCKSRKQRENFLLDRAKLYYNDLDEGAKLVYQALGKYNLEN